MKDLKGRLFAVLIVSAMVIGLAAAIVATPAPSEDGVPAQEVPAHLSYTVHATILIDGNAGFLGINASTGISWGNGTADDPYIIEGWEIAATTAHGITIQNTNAHFIIRDCYIWDDVTDYFDIALLNCTNGVLSGNKCATSPYGIYLLFSNNNTLINNNCSNNQVGIYLASSNGNTLSDNNCSNDQRSIYLASSSNNNILTNNTCSHDTSYAIYLESSNGNTLSNNTCTYNTNYGFLIYSSSNNKLLGNNASNNNEFGIYIWLSSGTIVTNNTITKNSWYGIRINQAPNNVISDNYIANNTRYAIYVWNAVSANNRIWNNTFYHNNGSGDSYLQSKNQALDSGGVNFWNSTDGYGNYWADWTTPDAVWRFGIVDLPYNVTGTRHAQDHYPLTTPGTAAPPIPEFSEFIVPIAGLMLIALIFGRARKKL